MTTIEKYPELKDALPRYQELWGRWPFLSFEEESEMRALEKRIEEVIPSRPRKESARDRERRELREKVARYEKALREITEVEISSNPRSAAIKMHLLALKEG